MKKFNLTQQEENLFKSLNTPKKIQCFLNTLPINFEEKRETCFSPRLVLKNQKCHCMEGAMFAAAVLWFHGNKPILVDLKGRDDDWDHVIAIFKKDGFFGAISKTNHSVLRYRDPVYKSIRELVMSYFHEYTDDRNLGKKTLRSFSNPVNLAKYGKKWITSEKDLWEIPTDLDKVKHFNILTKKQIANLKTLDNVEIQAGNLIEWEKSKSTI